MSPCCCCLFFHKKCRGEIEKNSEKVLEELKTDKRTKYLFTRYILGKDDLENPPPEWALK